MADAAPAARPVKLIAFAASVRHASFNRRLLAQAVPLAREVGADVEVHDFAEFVFPGYDANLQAAEGIPGPVLRLAELVAGADALMIASPEYNASMPGTLKNTIDWLSRIRPVPLHRKWVLLLSASNSLVGGNRGLWALRVPFEFLGSMVHPEMFSLARASEAFHEDGRLKDEAMHARLKGTIDGFLRVVERARA